MSDSGAQTLTAKQSVHLVASGGGQASRRPRLDGGCAEAKTAKAQCSRPTFLPDSPADKSLVPSLPATSVLRTAGAWAVEMAEGGPG